MKKTPSEIVVSIDIGGTSIKLGIITSNRTILKKDSITTCTIQSERQFYDILTNKINSLLTTLNFNWELIGIGIGSPGVSQTKGEIHHAANLHFLKKSNIISILQRKMEVPVYLIKDSNAAGLGEGLYGAAAGMRDYILITLGTGLGCSIFVNNKLLKGNTGLAGEFGHAIIKEGGRACGCGRNGCLETYVSASGIVRTFVELLALHKTKSNLRDLSFRELTPKVIYEAAKEGDKIALQSFELTGKVLGLQLSNLLTLFDSEAIILAGGLTNASEFLLPSIIYHIEKNTLPFCKGKAKVLLSALDTNEAALLGAASMVWQNQNVTVL